MKVRIVRQPTGLLNAQPWPAAGEEIHLPAVVAKSMAEAGDVEIIVEKAVAPEGEKRRGPGRPRKIEAD